MKTPVIRMQSGREVNPFALRAEDIDVTDIAHGLSLINRFVGQTRFPISVGKHSVDAAVLCKVHLNAPVQVQLQALLHDASEAYLGDVTKWVKSSPEMAKYREIEEQVQRTIFRTFEVPEELDERVEFVDRVLVRYEGRMGFESFSIDHPNYPPLTTAEVRSCDIAWQRWREHSPIWQGVRSDFLWLFNKLTGRPNQ